MTHSANEPHDPCGNRGWKRHLARLNTLWRKQRGSSTLFWDMDQAVHKPLPPVPPLPPLDARFHGDTSAEPKPKRPLTWSEQQINRLQKEAQELRQEVIDRRRIDMEKDHRIALLEQQISRYVREVDRHSEMETLVKTIIVAVHDFQQANSQKSSNPSDHSVSPLGLIDRDSEALGDASSGIIQVYSHF